MLNPFIQMPVGWKESDK
ncbi:hypothetical protein [Paenibacillus pinihumi]|nr:hypothetical protein [Paenibacillus pinihumi]